jgi:hypothetical protein
VNIPFKCVVAVIAALAFLSPAGIAQQKASSTERELFDSANRERRAQGLPPLKWDEALAGAARQHASLMAQQNSISHQFSGEPDLSARAAKAGARFSMIAENVAEGPSAASIHAQWMKSPPHRANLLDADADSVGIAVAERKGQLFAVEDFSQAVVNLTVDQQEREVGALLKARGLRLLENAEDARKTCALNKGFAGSRRPLLMVRFESADLSRLPDAMEKKIRSGRYHTAAVGACPAGSQSGFVNYRVAVLLY